LPWFSAITNPPLDKQAVRSGVWMIDAAWCIVVACGVCSAPSKPGGLDDDSMDELCSCGNGGPPLPLLLSLRPPTAMGSGRASSGAQPPYCRRRGALLAAIVTHRPCRSELVAGKCPFHGCQFLQSHHHITSVRSATVCSTAVSWLFWAGPGQRNLRPCAKSKAV
jgi:hypothetical protein